MELTLRNVRLVTDPGEVLDVGVDGGKIVAVSAGLSPGDQDLDAAGRLAVPGFVETHIHLDKSCILHRCAARGGDLNEAIGEVARLKGEFTEHDVAERARRTLEKCVVNGTTRMRTHVEVDPVIGLRGLAGVKRAVAEMAWAIEVEICVFPQEGLLNNPGTDSDPHGQIDRVFEMAREFDVDIDMHLDLSADASRLDAEYVCRQTDKYGWGGRVAIGHVTKLSALTPRRLARAAAMLGDAGVAVTALPATDLFLMHRDHSHNVPRGVAPLQALLERGVNCSLSTNNVLNPFTPFGDCSLIRMANLYANIAQTGDLAALAECLAMISTRSAKLLNLDDYGIAPGMPADLVVLDSADPSLVVAELSQPMYGFKAGRPTFTRALPELHWPR